jgi:hypothetical protein
VVKEKKKKKNRAKSNVDEEDAAVRERGPVGINIAIDDRMVSAQTPQETCLLSIVQ